MALINCPKCGKSISDRAVKCPHCEREEERKADVVICISIVFAIIAVTIVFISNFAK